MFGPPKDEMLQKVSYSCPLARFIGRADIHTDTHSNRKRAGKLKMDEADTVLQHSLLRHSIENGGYRGHECGLLSYKAFSHRLLQMA